MKAHNLVWLFAIAGLLLDRPALATAPATHVAQFEEIVAKCAPDIHPQTFKAVVTTESTFNPFAIGVVDGKLKRTPKTQEEAIATAKQLERDGFNFSLGLTQVNRFNLAKYGQSYETIFEPCTNVKVGAAILRDCYERALSRYGDEQRALRASFSCYYSGNFTRGFKPDRPGEASYVQKVVANGLAPKDKIIVPAIKNAPSDLETKNDVVVARTLPRRTKVKVKEGSDWYSTVGDTRSVKAHSIRDIGASINNDDFVQIMK